MGTTGDSGQLIRERGRTGAITYPPGSENSALGVSAPAGGVIYIHGEKL